MMLVGRTFSSTHPRPGSNLKLGKIHHAFSHIDSCDGSRNGRDVETKAGEFSSASALLYEQPHYRVLTLFCCETQRLITLV